MDYGILCLVPTVVAITLAITTRQVVLSLLAGVFAGSWILAGGNIVAGFTKTFGYVTGAMIDEGHANILIFTLGISGMVALLNSMGGTQAIATTFARKIKSARGAQVVTSLVGCLVFFDDYANILIVGPTMRPLTDQLKVSREKLTYLVHTTAGIVSGIAIMTTWIGYEIGLVTDSFDNLGYEVNGFMTVLHNIPFMFYNFFAIIIMFAVALMMRDFGPMYKAERRARMTGKLFADNANVPKREQDKEQVNGKIWYAFLPIITLALIVFFGIWITGAQALGGSISDFPLRDCFGEADPMPPIVWATMTSTLVAALIAKFAVHFSIKTMYSKWLTGFKDFCEVGIIIVIAWSLGSVVTDIGTAEFLIGVVSGNVSAGVLPACVFAVTCLISFSTGTSWGTMPIVFPIAIPLIAAFVQDPTNSNLVLATIAACLSGSIFGDQTSPISDSSILSSASSGCDLIHHVKTQIPYAIVPAACGVLCYLLVGLLDLSAGIPLILGTVLIVLIVRFVGKTTDERKLNESQVV